jgi:hypothetical protein
MRIIHYKSIFLIKKIIFTIFFDWTIKDRYLT